MLSFKDIKVKMDSLPVADTVGTPETLKAIDFFHKVGGILTKVAEDGKVDLKDLQYFDDVFQEGLKAFQNVKAIPAELKDLDFNEMVTIGTNLAYAGKSLWDGVMSVVTVFQKTPQQTSETSDIVQV